MSGLGRIGKRQAGVVNNSVVSDQAQGDLSRLVHCLGEPDFIGRRRTTVAALVVVVVACVCLEQADVGHCAEEACLAAVGGLSLHIAEPNVQVWREVFAHELKHCDLRVSIELFEE